MLYGSRGTGGGTAMDTSTYTYTSSSSYNEKKEEYKSPDKIDEERVEHELHLVFRHNPKDYSKEKEKWEEWLKQRKEERRQEWLKEERKKERRAKWALRALDAKMAMKRCNII